jgi:hypothetical protein
MSSLRRKEGQLLNLFFENLITSQQIRRDVPSILTTPGLSKLIILIFMSDCLFYDQRPFSDMR